MEEAKQVRANISPKLHGAMTRAARRLGIAYKDFIQQAIEAKLGEFDVALECKKLRACNTTLSVEKEQFRKERDEARDARNAACQERDTFKAKAEEKASELAVCEDKIRLLLDRGLWDRVRNALPWVETTE